MESMRHCGGDDRDRVGGARPKRAPSAHGTVLTDLVHGSSCEPDPFISGQPVRLLLFGRQVLMEIIDEPPVGEGLLHGKRVGQCPPLPVRENHSGRLGLNAAFDQLCV